MSSIPCENNTAYTRQELIRACSQGVSFTESLLLRLHDCTLEIFCSSEELRSELHRYFLPLLSSSNEGAQIRIHGIDAVTPSLNCKFSKRKLEPGKTKIKEEWASLHGGRVVRKITTGMMMIFGHDENLVIGPCQDNPNQVINFINNRFIEYKLNKGALLGHAAAVYRNGTGIAMAGFSGMGKSTLALHLMNTGADFVSNDRLLIEEKGEHLVMSGVAKWPRINPGTALNNPSLSGVMSAEEKERFSQLPAAELWNLEYKYDVMIEQCFGRDRFQLHTKLDRLVLLNWRFGAGSMQAEEVDLGKRKELLQAIMKETGLFYLPAKGCLKNQPASRYLELLSRCRVLELSGGADFEEATRTILKWL